MQGNESGRRQEAFHRQCTRRTVYSTSVLAIAAVALLACAGSAEKDAPASTAHPPSDPSAAGAPPDAIPPPVLRAGFPPGQELRFRRTIQSTARTTGLPADPGGLNGIDIRSEVEFLVEAEEGGASGPGTLKVRLAECALETRGLQGEVSFDTRRPESLKALAAVPGGTKMLKDVREAQAAQKAYGLLPDGTLKVEKLDARADVPGGPRGPGGPFGFRIGWFPGRLPFGHLEAGAAEGASWRFEGALPAGLSGVRYDEPLPVGGTWAYSKWQPDSRTARLVLEGGARSKDQRLRTTRVESCDLQGEATWDADRGLVTASSVTAHVVLVVIENPSIRIDWILKVDEALVP